MIGGYTERREWSTIWTPLLQAAVRGGTDVNHRLGLKHFLEWVEVEHGEPLRTARDVDVALCEYGWWVFENWAGRGKWRLVMAVFGVEHYMPELEKQLRLARRSLQGWLARSQRGSPSAPALACPHPT